MNNKDFWAGILLFIALYFVVANLVFAFKNPQLTDTQRLLMIHRALIWEKVVK